MFPDVNNLLNISPNSFRNGNFIGLCERNADSSFLIHHFLSMYLKQNCNVVFMSLCQSFNHYNNVGSKIGTSLALAKDNNKLIFIDGLRSIGLSINSDFGLVEKPAFINETGGVDIKLLYEMLVDQLRTVSRDKKTGDSNTVLIMDHMSVLLDVGVSPEDLIALIHYLNRYVVQQLGGCMVLDMNNDMGTDDEDGNRVWKFIQHSCTLALEIHGLESGYSKDVHGQIQATWPLVKGERTIDTSSLKSSQFKLTDKTCQLFASGMSSAVL